MRNFITSNPVPGPMPHLPSFDEDLFSDSVIQNPWPVYARMRKLGPVVWLPKLGNYALTQHREVQQALRDHNTFISSKGVAADQFGCEFLQGNTVASDDERHSILRSAMAPPILPGALGPVQEKIQVSADERIDQLVERSQFDAVKDLACFLPFSVVRDLVGLPEFGQQRMLHWAGAAFDVLGIQNQRGKDALPVIAEMREFIERDATRENLKPGSWTHRIHELVDQGLMPAECAAYAIRDYINPSLDTTISATAELIRLLADNPEQWEMLKQKPELIGNAVNEAVRLSTPIRTFSRQVAKDIEITGIHIPVGSRVMMLFASANRDERKFTQADKFDVTRSNKDHVGFGSGIHMCVGMHLAQLEMQSLLRAMLPRVAAINIGKPVVKLNNTICAYDKLPCSFSAEQREIFATPSSHDSIRKDYLVAEVTARRNIAQNIDSFDLTPVDRDSFPLASAGAHIDLLLPSGLVRQYSLTGDIEKNVYRIAVQKEADSRGGSQQVHEQLIVGSHIRINPPRNHFALVQNDEPTILIAGGIGMTPLLAMAWSLHHRNCDFQLHICAQTRMRLPFGKEQTTWPFADRLHVYIDDESTPGASLDVRSLVRTLGNRLQAYVCGPTGFMDKVTADAVSAGLDESRIHTEHFSAQTNATGAPFTLIASKSGKTFTVPSDKSAYQVLTSAGIAVDTSCEQGVCGSCLTPVLRGIPDHQDSVQTEAEKSSNQRFAVCCSRSKTKILVLDI